MVIRKLCLVLLIVSSLSYHILLADDTVSEKISEHVLVYHNYNQFNGNILVIKDGEEIFKHNYGFSDFNRNLSHNDETEFYIASIAKQFTAYAILLLVQKQQLQLDDHIGTYVKDLPPHIHYLTIHQLLNHTSGLPDYFSAGILKQYMHNEDVIQWLIKQDLTYIPGSTFHYSNPGYILLAEAIEHISIKSYAEFMRDTIFYPNRLYHTHIANDLQKDSTNIAKGYDHLYELYDYNLKTYGAGGIYSTIQDLYTWHRYLLEQNEISDTLYSLMFTPTHTADGSVIQVGYGWGILQNYPGFVITNGACMGFRGTIIRSITEDTIIIALTNKTCEQTEKICLEIMELLHGLEIDPPAPPKHRKEIPIPDEVLQSYCGEFSFGGYKISISLKNGKLIYKEPGMRENVLYAEDENHFFMKSFNIQCSFERIDTTLMLVIDNNGKIYKGQKITHP